MKISKFLRENALEISKRIISNQIQDKNKQYTDKQILKTQDDLVSFIDYLSTAMELDRDNVFVDYVIWFAKRSVIEDKNMADFIENLNYLKEMLKKDEIDKYELKKTYEFIEKAIVVLKDEKYQTEDNDSSSSTKIWYKYVEKLLKKDKDGAEKLVNEEYKKDHNIKRIYEEIFVEALHKTGELWEKGEISVAQEHYISAFTQSIISSYYSEVLKSKKNGMKAIVACIGNELHEMGIRMISDLFELEGFDTYYLGANIPIEEVLQEVKMNKPEVVALSVTMSIYLQEAKELIKLIKDKYGKTLIVVGGRAFDRNKLMWKEVGADYYIQNGMEAPMKIKKMLRDDYEK